MNRMVPAAPGEAIAYPDSDGRPIADNTRQARWITVFFGNLSAQCREADDVFVAMDLLWYAVEGHPEIRTAPDVMVVFGRPKGDRGSYKQWEEGGVPVTVAFEVLSPGNSPFEMADKLAFYDEHGVQEYYLYDPEHNLLAAYVRRGEALRRVWHADGFVSPRLGIRFDLSGPEMAVYGPEGEPFLTFEELQAERDRERHERLAAEQRARAAEQRARAAEQRGDRQAELMRRVLRQEATAEELRELQRLLEQPPPPA